MSLNDVTVSPCDYR